MTDTKAVRLIIYPYDQKQPYKTYNSAGQQEEVFAGSLWVMNGNHEVVDIVAGPPPDRQKSDRGGHYAESTAAGIYVLDKGEAHTSAGWPASVVPWGAEIREQNGIIQYRIGNQWRDATGPRGTVTQASRLFFARTPNAKVSPQEIESSARSLFIDPRTGKLSPTYKNNDFGVISWNMKLNGKRTALYIHTTPANEWSTANGSNVVLGQSHGCIHIRPVDRDMLMKKGYLKEGTIVEVKKYGEAGPPPGFFGH